ncbi:MAG: PAS-domain containing protein [Thalassobaculum sp.]|uniref:PAS domain-containing sensor histidine kinase n=1 Tax=Thalassobaculum sp. TaxID=2022740 RepID=UPI0032EDFBA6
MPSSTSRTLTIFIGAMLLILAVLITASIGGIAAVDIIRSYSGGATYYAKGHLSGVASLRRYAATGSPEDLHRYRRDIYLPASLGIARDILEQPDLPVGNSYPFLIGGNIHPEDAAGIAWMYRIFSATALLDPAAQLWRDADLEMLRIDALAGKLQRAWADMPADRPARERLLAEVETVDARLSDIEDRFSRQLGELARSIARLVGAGLAGLAVVLATLVLALGKRTQLRLALAQRAIHEREERFRDVADMAADWIWETDEQLRFSFFSDRVERAIGAPKETLLGKSRREAAHVEDADAWRRHMDDMAAHRPFHGFEYAFRRPSGELRHFRASGKPVFDGDGRFVGYRGTSTDVTEEVAARRAVAANSALLETVFENMAQGISVVGADLKARAFNTRFLDLLGFPRDRFRIGDPFEAFIRYNAERGEYGDVDVEAHVARALEAARRFEPHAVARIRPDGTVLEIRGQPMPGGGFVTTYTDITELRRATRDLQTAKIAAETANLAKSTFLANMSHELRTPLNAVIGFADLMAEERFGPLGPRYTGYARDIRQSGQHLLGVINDILDIARVEAGKIDLTVAPVAPISVVEGCFRMLRQRALEAGVGLRNEVPAGAPPLHADMQRLRQIILNLVGNAIKFSQEGAEVLVQYVEAGSSNGLRVVDRGIGIPDHLIDSAFEPFTQLHAGFGRRYDGAGLGLPLVRHFMDLHGGTVSLESAPGAGTTVTVLFPAEPAVAPAAATAARR